MNTYEYCVRTEVDGLWFMVHLDFMSGLLTVMPHHLANVRSRNITIFVESIRIRLISRIINQVIELSPLSYSCTS